MSLLKMLVVIDKDKFSQLDNSSKNNFEQNKVQQSYEK